MKSTTPGKQDSFKESLDSVTEKSTEVAKAFIEGSTKQFEANMNASKAIFEIFTKQFQSKEKNLGEKQVKESLENTVNIANTWLSDSTKVLKELFDAQFKFIVESYSDLMDIAAESHIPSSELGAKSLSSRIEFFLKNVKESSEVSKKMFSNIMDSLSDSKDKGRIKEISDMMLDSYSMQTEQLIKFYTNLLRTDNLQKSMKLNKEVSEKLQKDLEKNFEASKKIIKSIADSYIEENDFSPKAGKKMLSEIYDEIDVVTKNNIKFWTNWFNETANSNKETKREKASKNGLN
jgi:hypothetical protein